MNELLYEVFDPLPRQGPGCDEATARALRGMAELAERPRILDVGCGSGAQTVALARRILGQVVAVDNHPPYLDAVRARAERLGVADRVTCVGGDMGALEFDDGSFDAIWCEGAIYILGFAKGLRQWRRLLRPHGYVAVTEVAWLRPDPPEELRRFWESEYPAITDSASNIATLEASGYRALEHFALPPSAWWDDLYHPLEEHARVLRAKYADNAEALGFLDSVAAEIDMYRRFSDFYGYVFYVGRRAD